MESKELLQSTSLDWTVKKTEIQTVDGILIPEKVAIVREDTKEILSVMGKDYEAFQNHETMELLFKINQSTGLQIHKSGYFNEGQKVYIQLKSDDLSLNGDTIKGFITAVNSFDGSTSLAFGNSTITISCMNTFFQVFRALESKIRHTKSLRPKVDEILFGIDKLLGEEQKHFEYIKKMSEIDINDKLQTDIIRILFDIEKSEDMEKLSTRKENLINLFKTGWDREINEKGKNLWGAMSATTYFGTHLQHKTSDKSQYAKMFAKTGANERMVWNQLVHMV